jgi:manganese-dependent inorganic pyrophosphatase
MKRLRHLIWQSVIGCAISFVIVSCSTLRHPVVQKSERGKAYRDLLKKLDWGSDTCYIYGHKTPDVDAATSALSMATLMRALGYNCMAKVSSPVNRESAYIAGLFGFELPELKSSVLPDTRLILTDHTDYAQCVNGARQAIILQKIDHHVEGDITDAGIPYVRREMIGSTNTIIYQMYRELGVTIDNETARIMLAGILSDTRNLSKSTTQRIDSTAWLALTTQLGLSPDSVAKINKGMKDAASDFTGMTDAEIFLSDYKDYEISSHLVGFGSLDVKQAEAEAFIDRMLAVMPEVMTLMKRQMLFAKIDVSRVNGTYFIYYGPGAQAVAEAVFGPSVRAGVTFTEQELSRKQIVPLINDVLK